MKAIDDFLEKFRLSDNIIEVFTCGGGYWFAYILFRRFIRDGAVIVFNKATAHFGTRIGNIVYDITGDVTVEYDWIPWVEMKDDEYKARITKEYVMFEKS